MKQANPRSLIENARRGGYAVGAYNMHNEETTEALVWAAARALVAVVKFVLARCSATSAATWAQ